MPKTNQLALKERMKIPRAKMPELDPEVRAHNFEEVNQGLSALAVRHHVNISDLAKLGEGFAERIRGRVKGQIAYVESISHVSPDESGSRSRSGGTRRWAVNGASLSIAAGRDELTAATPRCVGSVRTTRSRIERAANRLE